MVLIIGKGQSKFVFPKKYILKSGTSIVISSRDSVASLQWTKINVWNNPKSDSKKYTTIREI